MTGGRADCRAWLEQWFRSRGAVVPGNVASTTGTSYLEAGLIDSLGVVELIEDIEQTFAIRFEADHFQDRRFPSIEGLAEIISELTGAGQVGS